MKIDRQNSAMSMPLESAKQSSSTKGKNEGRELSPNKRYQDRVEISNRYQVEPEDHHRHSSNADSYSGGEMTTRRVEAEGQNLVTYGRQLISNNTPRSFADATERSNAPSMQSMDLDKSKSLPLERLQEIQSRITRGYYEQDRLIQSLAGLIAEDLQKERPIGLGV